VEQIDIYAGLFASSENLSVVSEIR
jgi:hypothetical protein